MNCDIVHDNMPYERYRECDIFVGYDTKHIDPIKYWDLGQDAVKEGHEQLYDADALIVTDDMLQSHTLTQYLQEEHDAAAVVEYAHDDDLLSSRYEVGALYVTHVSP